MRAQDTQLLHHYCNVTAWTIATDAHKRHVWRFRIPQIAQESRYLYHGVLALAAVHQASLQPSNGQTYRRIAGYHKSAAAENFRTTVQKVTADNCIAVCTSAGITILTELGSFHQGENYDPIIELLDKLKLVRSVVPLWQSSLHYMLQDKDSAVLLKRDAIHQAEHLSHDVHLALLRLGELLYKQALPTEDEKSCEHAIKVLACDFTVVLLKSQDFGQALRWGETVDEHFLNLVQRKEPLALIILAHFCVLLAHATGQWCFKGWVDDVFEAIKTAVGQRWIHHLDWAAKAMKHDPRKKPGDPPVAEMQCIEIVEDGSGRPKQDSEYRNYVASRVLAFNNRFSSSPWWMKPDCVEHS